MDKATKDRMKRIAQEYVDAERPEANEIQWNDDEDERHFLAIMVLAYEEGYQDRIEDMS